MHKYEDQHIEQMEELLMNFGVIPIFNIRILLFFYQAFFAKPSHTVFRESGWFLLLDNLPKPSTPPTLASERWFLLLLVTCGVFLAPSSPPILPPSPHPKSTRRTYIYNIRAHAVTGRELATDRQKREKKERTVGNCGRRLNGGIATTAAQKLPFLWPKKQWRRRLSEDYGKLLILCSHTGLLYWVISDKAGQGGEGRARERRVKAEPAEGQSSFIVFSMQTLRFSTSQCPPPSPFPPLLPNKPYSNIHSRWRAAWLYYRTISLTVR